MRSGANAARGRDRDVTQEAVDVALDDLEIEPASERGHHLTPLRRHDSGGRILQTGHAVERTDTVPRGEAEQGARAQSVFVHRDRDQSEMQRSGGRLDPWPGQRFDADGVTGSRGRHQGDDRRMLRASADDDPARIVRDLALAGQPRRPRPPDRPWLSPGVR